MAIYPIRKRLTGVAVGTGRVALAMAPNHQSRSSQGTARRDGASPGAAIDLTACRVRDLPASPLAGPMNDGSARWRGRSSCRASPASASRSGCGGSSPWCRPSRSWRSGSTPRGRQVVLSLVLPIPMIALLILTQRRDIMGRYVNGRLTAVAAIGAAAIVLILNLLLILQTAGVSLLCVAAAR